MNIYYLGTHQFSVLSDILLNGLRFSRVTSARQWNCDLLTFLPLIEHTAPHGWLSSERNSKTSWVTPIQWVTENTPMEVGRKAETHAINPSLLQLLENLPAPVFSLSEGFRSQVYCSDFYLGETMGLSIHEFPRITFSKEVVFKWVWTVARRTNL